MIIYCLGYGVLQQIRRSDWRGEWHARPGFWSHRNVGFFSDLHMVGNVAYLLFTKKVWVMYNIIIWSRSRLGCQVIASPELDGLRLALPAATRNFAVDGYKPKPH